MVKNKENNNIDKNCFIISYVNQEKLFGIYSKLSKIPELLSPVNFIVFYFLWDRKGEISNIRGIDIPKRGNIKELFHYLLYVTTISTGVIIYQVKINIINMVTYTGYKFQIHS